MFFVLFFLYFFLFLCVNLLQQYFKGFYCELFSFLQKNTSFFCCFWKQMDKLCVKTLGRLHQICRIKLNWVRVWNDCEKLHRFTSLLISFHSLFCCVVLFSFFLCFGLYFRFWLFGFHVFGGSCVWFFLLFFLGSLSFWKIGAKIKMQVKSNVCMDFKMINRDLKEATIKKRKHYCEIKRQLEEKLFVFIFFFHFWKR